MKYKKLITLEEKIAVACGIFTVTILFYNIHLNRIALMEKPVFTDDKIINKTMTNYYHNSNTNRIGGNHYERNSVK